MRPYYLIFPLLLFACKDSTRKDKVPSSVSKDGNKMAVKIMRITEDNKKNEKGLLFHARLFLKKDFLEQNENLSRDIQYQVDSSFYLIHAKDTLWPAYVLPVANGQPLMPEYIVSFEKDHIKDLSTIEFRSNLMKGLLFDSSIYFSLNSN